MKMTVHQMKIVSAEKTHDGRNFLKSKGTMKAGFELLKEGTTLALMVEQIEKKKGNKK